MAHCKCRITYGDIEVLLWLYLRAKRMQLYPLSIPMPFPLSPSLSLHLSLFVFRAVCAPAWLSWLKKMLFMRRRR